MLDPGEIFQKRYQIDREIGQGAFALVYLAHQLDDGRRVAIKVLKEGRSDDRFFREAKLLSELRSEHTVTLYEAGRADDTAFMVFEYVPGETLEDRLARVGPMPGGRVAHIIRQVLMSLAEAHDRGIVHRDVKPANIMMTDVAGDEDFVKVLDFGVAKPLDAVRDVSVELTVAGQIIGTMRYMAPEQLRDERKAVPASDVYAVGLIAYELLTAEKAAAGDDAHYVLAQHLSREPFFIAEHLDVPQPFKRAFEGMMSKDLAIRPRDASEALRSLDFRDDDATTFDQRVHVRPAKRPSEEEVPAFGALKDQSYERPADNEQSLRIDRDALAENRKRVTRGVTAALPNIPPEKENDSDRLVTIFLVAVALVVFVLLTVVLSRFLNV